MVSKWLNVTFPHRPVELNYVAKSAALAVAKRRGMTIHASKRGRSKRLEFRGGPETEIEVIVAAGVRGAAVEAEIAHILRGQPQVYIRKRRIRLAPGHVADFENHAVRVGAAIRATRVAAVVRAGGTKLLDRWRDSGRKAVGD